MEDHFDLELSDKVLIKKQGHLLQPKQRVDRYGQQIIEDLCHRRLNVAGEVKGHSMKSL